MPDAGDYGGCQCFRRRKYLNECTLYVTLEPCVIVMRGGHRMGAIETSGFTGQRMKKRRIQDVCTQALHPRTEVVSGVMADEAVAC